MSSEPVLGWRDHRSARTRVAQHIGGWPGTVSRAARAATIANGSLIGSFSHNHACDVWNSVRADVLASAGSLGEHVEPVADLAMVSGLASHLMACERCWRTGPYDTDTPVAWITWAVARRPRLRRILEPVLLELAGSRGAMRPTPPMR